MTTKKQTQRNALLIKKAVDYTERERDKVIYLPYNSILAEAFPLVCNPMSPSTPPIIAKYMNSLALEVAVEQSCQNDRTGEVDTSIRRLFNGGRCAFGDRSNEEIQYRGEFLKAFERLHELGGNLIPAHFGTIHSALKYATLLVQLSGSNSQYELFHPDARKENPKIIMDNKGIIIEGYKIASDSVEPEYLYHKRKKGAPRRDTSLETIYLTSTAFTEKLLEHLADYRNHLDEVVERTHRLLNEKRFKWEGHIDYILTTNEQVEEFEQNIFNSIREFQEKIRKDLEQDKPKHLGTYALNELCFW